MYQSICMSETLLHGFTVANRMIVYVTLRAKINLVHTSKFATSMAYNFCWERHAESKLSGIID